MTLIDIIDIVLLASVTFVVILAIWNQLIVDDACNGCIFGQCGYCPTCSHDPTHRNLFFPLKQWFKKVL